MKTKNISILFTISLACLFSLFPLDVAKAEQITLVIDYKGGTSTTHMATAIDDALATAGLADGSTITSAIFVGTGTITGPSSSTTANGAVFTQKLPNCTFLDLTGYTGTFGAYAFSYTKNITTVKIPNTAIGERMFLGSTNLNTLSVGDANITPGVADFTGFTKSYNRHMLANTNITTMRIPENIRIYYLSFYDITKLTTLTTGTKDFIPGVVDLSDYAQTGYHDGQEFQGCTSITTVKMKIGMPLSYSMFYGCTSLSTLSFGPQDPIPGVIDLTNYTYRSTGGDTGRVTFFNCSSITTVKLPVEQVFIQDTFRSCKNLTTILGNTSQEGLLDITNTNMFASVHADCKLYKLPGTLLTTTGGLPADAILEYGSVTATATSAIKSATVSITQSSNPPPPLTNYVVMYRKIGDLDWLYVESSGDIAELTDLASNTSYEYKVYPSLIAYGINGSADIFTSNISTFSTAKGGNIRGKVMLSGTAGRVNLQVLQGGIATSHATTIEHAANGAVVPFEIPDVAAGSAYRLQASCLGMTSAYTDLPTISADVNVDIPETLVLYAGNVNNDDVIDYEDYVVFLNHYGKRASGT